MSNTFSRSQSRTWATIDLAQVTQNARALAASVAPHATLMAVVKANAYGHGAAPIARACAQARITHFAVATVDEALELRQAGITGDVYLFAAFLPEEAETIVRTDIIPMVSDPAQLDALAQAGRHSPFPARAFLTVDTGMGREGALPPLAQAIWDAAQAQAGVRVTGVVTHFCSADDPEEVMTQAQVGVYADFLHTLGERQKETFGGDDGRGNCGIWLSLANSPATLRGRYAPLPPQTLPARLCVRGYLARVGLLLYGGESWPGAIAERDLAVWPALTWQTRVTLVRDLPAGSTVGYGQTHTLTRSSRIATVAVGYADGYSRDLSNRGSVLIRGSRCPIVGRVSMDQTQVDVTDLPGVAVGEVATLLGTDGRESITVLDLARLVDTTPHDITCAISRRVPRLYRPITTAKEFTP